MECAAGGDRDAQQLLALGGLLVHTNGYVQEPGEASLAEILMTAETFARLAAVDGDIGAVSILAAVIKVRSDHAAEGGFYERAQKLWAEAASLMFDCALAGNTEAARCLIENLEARADAGMEDAALDLNTVVEALPPATLAAARQPEAAQAAA